MCTFLFLQENPNVIFLEIDTDESEDISADYEVTQLPKFIFIKNQQIVRTFLKVK